MDQKRLRQLVNVTVFIVMMFFIIAGLIVSVPLLALIFGPKPSRLIALFGVIPITSIILYILVSLGIAVGMLFWKPFLTTSQARECFFEPVTPENEIPKFFNSLFVKPYYKLAFLIFPEVKEEFKQ